MKSSLFVIFSLIVLSGYSQFLELNEVVVSPCNVAAKDYQGFLYGTRANKVYRKTDTQDTNWEVVFEGTAGSYDVCVTDRQNHPKYIYTSSGDTKKSNDGVNWSNQTFSGISGTLYRMKYTENGDLFLLTSSNTYRSTNGGTSFSIFLSEPITEIEYDAFTNRFLFTKRPTITTVDVCAFNISTSNISVIETGLPFAEYVRQLISVSKDGTFFMTSDGAFDYIYKYENGNAPSEEIYPVPGSSPIHTRSLVSTQTGRTWVGSWGFGLTSVEDDTLHYTYNRPTQYQYMCETMFLDRSGYLYYSYTSQNIPVGYVKSSFSVRQPVFFERMEDIETTGVYGKFMRISNNLMMCTKTDGKVFTSTDNGDNWEFKEDLIPSISANLTVFSKHPSGKLMYGNSFGTNYLSEDNGQSWTQNSNLGGRLADVAHSITEGQSLLIYDGEVSLSMDTLQTKSTLLTTVTTHPVYGTIAAFSTGLITSQNTFLVAGRINESYVKRSVDGGTTWEDILPNGIYHQHIWDLYEDDQNQIWLASDSGLFVSNNDGLTWQKDQNYPGKAHYIIQNSTNELVVTNQAGNSNSGSTYVFRDNQWNRISYGHNMGMSDLYLDPVSNRIFGSGMYRSIEGDEQGILSLTDDNLSIDDSDEELLIYPNPANNYLNIKHGGEYNPIIQIYDLKGTLVIETTKTSQIEISGLEKGLYTVIVKSNSSVSQGKFIKY